LGRRGEVWWCVIRWWLKGKGDLGCGWKRHMYIYGGGEERI
jgi:hypothetical protein